MEDKALATIPQALSSTEFNKRHKELAQFVNKQLRKAKQFKDERGYDKIGEGDYGVIPQTSKMSLLKPGAEKLLKLFGFTAHMELVKEIEDFQTGFIMYKYRCIIVHAATNTFIADAVRSCNNKEKKHASKSVYDAANTIESIAQKRALVAATVQATMASEIFDADVSEYEDEAPKRTVTKEEDPRRNRLFAKLYSASMERGFGDKALHGAAKKLFNITDSLTELSNAQIEELTEKFIVTYKAVGKGNRPEKIVQEVVEADEVIEPKEVGQSRIDEDIDIDEVEKAMDKELAEAQKNLEQKREQFKGGNL